MRKFKNKAWLIGLVFFLLFSLTSIGIYGDDGTFTTLPGSASKTKLFLNISDYYNTELDNTSLYPSGTVFSWDTYYGVFKSPMSYRGEIPKNLATSKQADWAELPYWEDGTGWDPISAAGITTKADAEKATQNGSLSNELRLVALLHARKSESLIDVQALIYSFISFFLRLPLLALQVVVKIKSVDLLTILSSLGRGTFNKIYSVIKDAFIGDGSRVSPYLLLCISGFLICLGSAVWTWFKGNGATQKIKETILFALVGVIIIGAALTGRTYDFSQSLAHLSGVLVNLTISGDSSGGIWLNSIPDANKKKKEVELNELAMINRIYIDSTLENQFNVSPSDFPHDGTSNLAYKFWALNSDAEFTNGTRNAARYTRASDKYTAFEKWIDDLEGESGMSADKKREVIIGLANPSYNVIDVLLVGVEYVLLTWCLFSIAWKCAASHVFLLVASVALPVAGPLYLINNKKIRDAANTIMQLFILSFIRLTIWTLLFDVVICVCSYLFDATSFVRMITAILITAWLAKSGIPYITNLLSRLIERYESRNAGQLSRARNLLRSDVHRAAASAAARKAVSDHQTLNSNGEVVDKGDKRPKGLVGIAAQFVESASGDPNARISNKGDKKVVTASERFRGRVKDLFNDYKTYHNLEDNTLNHILVEQRILTDPDKADQVNSYVRTQMSAQTRVLYDDWATRQQEINENEQRLKYLLEKKQKNQTSQAEEREINILTQNKSVLEGAKSDAEKAFRHSLRDEYESILSKDQKIRDARGLIKKNENEIIRDYDRHSDIFKEEFSKVTSSKYGDDTSMIRDRLANKINSHYEYAANDAKFVDSISDRNDKGAETAIDPSNLETSMPTKKYEPTKVEPEKVKNTPSETPTNRGDEPGSKTNKGEEPGSADSQSSKLKSLLSQRGKPSEPAQPEVAIEQTYRTKSEPEEPRRPVNELRRREADEAQREIKKANAESAGMSTREGMEKLLKEGIHADDAETARKQIADAREVTDEELYARYEQQRIQEAMHGSTTVENLDMSEEPSGISDRESTRKSVSSEDMIEHIRSLKNNNNSDK